MSGAGRDQRTGDPVLDKVLQQVRTMFAPLLSLVLLKGLRLERLTLVPGRNAITHKLQRAPQGWWVTRVYEGVAILTEDTKTTSDTSLALDSAADCVVDLWVFG